MNLYGSRRYSKMDQVRLVEDSLHVILTITRIILKISSLCLMEIKNNFENQSKIVSNLFHDTLPVWLETNTPILQKPINWFICIWTEWFLYHGNIGLNPFHATGLFLYLPKTSENYRFSDAFRGYRKRPVP